MSRYIFSKNNRWYISEVFDPSDSKLQEKASYYTLTDDVTGPYYATGTSDSVSIGVSYVPVVEPAGAIEAGYIDANGNFQPLSFNDTQASDSGSAVQGLQHKIFNTGHDEPDYGTAQDSSLIFYAPLSSFQVAAKTGQGLQVNGTPSYSSYSGINSVLFSTSSTYLKTIVGMQSSAEVSISLWLYLNSQAEQSGGNYPRFLCLGSSSTADKASDWLCLTYDVSGQAFTFQAPDNNTWPTSAAPAVKDQWVHLACVYSHGTLTLYVNGTAQTGATVVNALNLPTGSTLYINYRNNQYSAGVDGSRMASLRIYNKALTTSQIQTLAAEFTPTSN